MVSAVTFTHRDATPCLYRTEIQSTKTSRRLSAGKLTVAHTASGIITARTVNIIVFCDVTPCSPLKVSRRFGGTSPVSFPNFPIYAPLYSCVACYSTMKTEATDSSQTLITLDQTTRCHIEEDRNHSVSQYISPPCKKCENSLPSGR
jgi:hypothetical protein